MITALYARVSTDEQCSDMQIEDMHLTCKARHWDHTKEYIDDGVSGAKRERPALDRLIADIKVGRISRIVVWRFDRMARSTLHMLEILDLCRDYNVEFLSIKESLDTSTAMGRAVMTILGAIAELERDTIRARQRAGIERAKKEGKFTGRPKKIFNRKLANEMHSAGATIREIAKALNISVMTVQREIAK